MSDTQSRLSPEIGMAGLGAMGRNLLLNMAYDGFAVACHDTDGIQIETFRKECAGRELSRNREHTLCLSNPQQGLLSPIDRAVSGISSHMNVSFPGLSGSCILNESMPKLSGGISEGSVKDE